MIYLDASDNIAAEGTPCNVSLYRGSLSCMVRCPDRATFDVQALAVGLTYEDEERGILPVPGVTITHLGPITAPGATEEDPPVVLDARHHVNFWLSPRLVERGAWKVWAKAWTAHGEAVEPNEEEQALEYQTVHLIDPDTVKSPSNVLL